MAYDAKKTFQTSSKAGKGNFGGVEKRSLLLSNMTTKPPSAGWTGPIEDTPSVLWAHEVIGALNIFCGGLVMAIDDSMPIAAEQLAEAVGHNNTMGICCFGEQGMDHKRRACHGNLMFGCLLFSNKPRDEASFKKSGQLGQVHDSVHA